MARSLSPRKERKQLVAKFTQGPTPRSNQSAAQAFAGALKRHGVDTVFGQSIPSLIHLAAPEFGIRQIAYRTENAGGDRWPTAMRASRHKVGVVTAQNGPAATLLVPAPRRGAEGVGAGRRAGAGRRRASNPTATPSRSSITSRCSSGCAKWVRRVHGAARIDDYVDMALHRRRERPARAGRAALPATI